MFPGFHFIYWGYSDHILFLCLAFSSQALLGPFFGVKKLVDFLPPAPLFRVCF
jgi:hypothetical protein